VGGKDLRRGGHRGGKPEAAWFTIKSKKRKNSTDLRKRYLRVRKDQEEKKGESFTRGLGWGSGGTAFEGRVEGGASRRGRRESKTLAKGEGLWGGEGVKSKRVRGGELAGGGRREDGVRSVVGGGGR